MSRLVWVLGTDSRHSSSSSGPASMTLYNSDYWVVVFQPRTAATSSLDSVPLVC